MTKTLRIHRLAEEELTDATLWYESKQPGLGASFLDLIDNSIDRLCSGLLPSSSVPGVRTVTKRAKSFAQTLSLFNRVL